MGNSFYNGDCAAAAVPSSTCTRPKASTVLSTDEEKNSDCSDCGNISRYLQIFCDSEKTLKSPSKSSIRTTEFLLSTGVLWVLILIRLVRVEVLSLRSFSDPSQRLKAFNSVKYVKWRSRWALLALPCWWCWSLRTNTRHRGNKWWCHRCQTPSSSHHCPGKDLSREKWKNNWNNDLDKKWKKNFEVDWLNDVEWNISLYAPKRFMGFWWFSSFFVSQVLLTATVQTFHGETFCLRLHWGVFGAWHVRGQTVAAAGAQIVFHVHGVNPQEQRVTWECKVFYEFQVDWFWWIEEGNHGLPDWHCFWVLIDSKQTGYPGCPRPGLMSPMKSLQHWELLKRWSRGKRRMPFDFKWF